ncbi:maleylacetate reductase [Actinoplanes italicus]|nr:maleylacetate reductase [Actinoplanes italicus]
MFGPAADHLAAEVARFGERPVVFGGAAPDLLPGAPRHRDVIMHVPVEAAARARAFAAANDADVLVSIGGGSSTGLAKAVALTSGLPIVAVPTTYAGSEATNVWGLTENGRKTTGADDRVLPRTIVYDAELTLSLPVGLSVASGLNALAHCVDSMWAPRADPINQALAVEGVRALSGGLPAIVRKPGDLQGRELTLYGAHLAAVAFASAGSGLHHKICHVLGGMFNLPHAQTHAVVLPYVMELNAPGIPDRLADAFGPGGLARLRAEVDAPRALRDHGFREGDIPAAAAAILAVVPAGNPVPVTTDNLTDLLRRAWAGEEPR